MTETPRALSGRQSTEITVEAVRSGVLGLNDVRIHPDTLRHQADVARDFGNSQLAENFLRAAELTAFDDDVVLGIYEALRPGRSTTAELDALAEKLELGGAPRNAALVSQAAVVYARRGISATEKH